MRITQWGEYGILLSLYIAQSERNGETPVGATDIASAHCIAVPYAQQILHRLRRGEIIESVRGPHGGYHLAASPSEITLKDVMTAVEGETFELICDTKPLDPDTRCAPHSPCILRPIWNELREHLNIFLTGYSLERLLNTSVLKDSLVQIHRPKS